MKSAHRCRRALEKNLSLRSGGGDFDVHPAVRPVKLHHAISQGEQREVAAHSDVAARMELGAALAHDDVATKHGLAAELLDAQPLAVAVATVLAGALSFLMGHGRRKLREPLRR